MEMILAWDWDLRELSDDLSTRAGSLCLEENIKAFLQDEKSSEYFSYVLDEMI